jgi:hypothetical protein
MARGWIAPSKGEQELAEQAERSWGPARKEKLLRRMAIAIVLVMMLVMAIFITMVVLQTAVEENYTVVYSAPNEMYVGDLDLSGSGWDSFLNATTLTLTFTIPKWNVSVSREMTFVNRTVDGSPRGFLRMAPITGQVQRDVSGERVPFYVRVTVETPHAEVAKLRFLGDRNRIEGTVTNHPDKPMVELTEYGKGVALIDDKLVRVKNEPRSDNVEYWFVQFSRTKLS